jgi:hypothetical protein
MDSGASPNAAHAGGHVALLFVCDASDLQCLARALRRVLVKALQWNTVTVTVTVTG